MSAALSIGASPKQIAPRRRTTKTRERMPLEHVIAIIEEAGSENLFYLQDLHAQVRNDPDWSDHDREMLWWLDHTLTLMVHHGLLHRHHIPTGTLGYSATMSWEERDEVIGCFKAPKPKCRRARDLKRQQLKELRRQERERRRLARLGNVERALWGSHEVTDSTNTRMARHDN